MDFSSPHRSLQSLLRRRPALDDEVLRIGERLLDSSSEDKDKEMEVEEIIKLINFPTKRWEALAVGLYLSTEVLGQQSKVYVEGPRVPTVVKETPDDSNVKKGLSEDKTLMLSEALLIACKTHLQHNEPRVRTLVAKSLGAVVALNLTDLKTSTLQLHDHIVDSIHHLLQAGRDTQGAYSKASDGALDDTTGWRALETNWQGLASYIAARPYFQNHQLTDGLLQSCRRSCLDHVNRHVRAAGINVLEQLIRACPNLEEQTNLRSTSITVLKEMLSDNWSQVRMAASVLCRVLWQHAKDTSDFMAPLLPRMCLNRFYLAQGVKLYSQDTWKMVFSDGNGLQAVADHAAAICRYYVKMCDADNHAVREAACQAVAELASKIGCHPQYAPKLEPYVQTLLQALLMCFHDESWPVRDEACLACGIFCRAYPEECRSELPLLKERWIEQLTDQIWSVREDAAVALGDALRAYPELWDEIITLLHKKLPSAKEQPPMTREQYKKHQNDINAHSEQQLYSCGSLAPKLRKGGAGRIGCSSCGITRPKAPWEATDGCIYLIRELVALEDKVTDDVLVPIIEELMDVCRVKHYPQSDDLRATLFRQLPVMANTLGKQRFKRVYLDIVLELIFNTLESQTESALSKHAAGQCAEELSELVGLAIFRGRLDDFQREIFDRVMRERRMMPKGPSKGDGFSPFGPPVPGGVQSGAIHPAIAAAGGSIHPGIAGATHPGIMGATAF